MSRIRLCLPAVEFWMLIALVAPASDASAADVRTWTDVAGRKTEAKFVRIFNGEVILEKDGRMLKAPLARFSAGDQKYIQELAALPESAAKSATKARPSSPKATNSTAPALAKQDASSADSNEPSAKQAATELRRMRDWRDNAGNKIKARFERLFGPQVVLSVGNRLRTIDFSRLSAADQDFLRRNLEAQGTAVELPVAAAPAADTTAGPTGPAAPTGIGEPGFPASGFPNFGDLASRMRQQQEQMRATHDQIRSQVQRMQDEMKATRERISSPAPQPAPLSNSIAPAGAPPAVPELSTAVATPPTLVAAPAQDPLARPATESRPQRATPRSPFERNRTAPMSSEPPDDQLAAAPSMEPQYQEIVICGACNKPQQPGFKAGQRCQHCGKTIDEIEDESGNVVDRSSRSTRRNIKFWVWAIIAGISVIGGLIAKLKGG